MFVLHGKYPKSYVKCFIYLNICFLYIVIMAINYKLGLNIYVLAKFSYKQCASNFAYLTYSFLCVYIFLP